MILDGAKAPVTSYEQICSEGNTWLGLAYYAYFYLLCYAVVLIRFIYYAQE